MIPLTFVSSGARRWGHRTRGSRNTLRCRTRGSRCIRLSQDPPRGYVRYQLKWKSLPTIPCFKFVFFTPLQEYTAVGNKAEVLLLRIASLDALFATLPGDVVEQKRRCEVTWYVANPTFLFSADLFPARLRTSRADCVPSTRSSPITSVPAGIRSGFSKTCRRQSSSIRFVGSLAHLSILTRTADGAANGNRSSRIRTGRRAFSCNAWATN